MQRFLIILSVLFSILFLPYWLYIPVLIAAIIIVPFFWEAVLFGFMISYLYGFGQIFSLYTIGPAITVLITDVVKQQLRFHV